VLGATSASANGRFPAAGQVVIGPTNPQHLVVRATYGILQSTDGGASWGWICEDSVGYGGVEDPAVALTAGGTLLAGIFEGLAVSHDLGCSFAFEGGPLAEQYVIDVTIEPNAPSHALAITSSGGGGGFHVVLVESLDDGATWAQAGVAVDTQFLALTVEVAASDPDRIYLSGLFGADYEGAVARTDDRGQSWSITPFDLQGGNGAYIGAVDPNDPDRLWVRVDHDQDDALYVSDDGAQTWTKVAEATGEMLGFALSPDGQSIAIGGPDFGLWVASSADHEFTQAAQIEVKCLKWPATALYACADEFADGFTIGRSVDLGETFESLYNLPDLAPLECAAETSTGKTCPANWPPVAETLGITGSGGGSSASSSGAGGSGADDDDDSGCALARAPARRGFVGVVVAVGAGLMWRRRRKRPS
jgi:hypothetical protein